MNSEYFIKKLSLSRHPEGGWYAETYRSTLAVAPQAVNDSSSFQYIYNKPHIACTCIYFLLTSGEFSAFHRLRSDEMWHFYAGTELEVFIISPEGVLTRNLLGSNGETFQILIPAGHWFAAKVFAKDSFSLVGCTVAPGFEFEDFELASRQQLIDEFPEHESIISQLTRLPNAT